jgi:hypothetical protein
VQYSVRFPKLQRLIPLRQHIINPDCKHKQNESSPQHRFPQLISLYTHYRYVGEGVIASHTLRELRLDVLEARWASHLPFPSIPHIEAIITNAPSDQKAIRGENGERKLGEWFQILPFR